MTGLIFGWLNLALFLIIAKYVYQKWFKSQLSTSISTKQDQFQALQNEVVGLENQIKDLAIDLVLQEKQSADLLDKLKRWQTVFINNQQAELLEFEQVQKNIIHKNKIKSQNLTLKLAQNQSLVQVIAQSTELLKNQFGHQQKANSMLCNVLDKLKRH